MRGVAKTIGKYCIETGIPIPKTDGGKGPGNKSNLRLAMEEMGIKDSIQTDLQPTRELAKRKRGKVIACAQPIKKECDWKRFCTRTLKTDKGWELRVWRIR